MDRKPWEPEQVFGEYESGRNFKAGLGRRGLYEQGKINERFYVGDQWHGAQCGNERPLVRHNVIKRIGDYKMAVISSNPVTVNYSVEGVPNTVAIRDRAREERDRYAGEQRTPMDAMGLPPEEETAVTMSSLTDYFKTTAERVKLDDLKEQALRNAYISGSGVLYTYWDDRIQTGLYADESGTTPITGDIACEVLDIENVYFGDPNLYELQEQPYILIAQRKSVKELRREARRNGRPVSDIEAIKPDRDTGHMAGGRSDDEPEETRKATVITKFWKEWDKDGAREIRSQNGDLGGTMRLGAYPCVLAPGSKAAAIYGCGEISERHRHRYEVNIQYESLLRKSGMLITGKSPDGKLPEIVERPEHPWFVGVQFHPELKSKPFAPHPLFVAFVKAAIDNSRLL